MSSTRRPSTATEPSPAALGELQQQVAALVAALMGVDGSWKTDPTDAPGWWLSTWARRLAVDVLRPPLATAVLTWLAGTQEVLVQGDTLPVERSLVERANELSEQGKGLESEIQQALGRQP